MSNSLNLCGLCRKSTDLKDSHCIPKGFFKLVRDNPGDSSLVAITSDKARRTSRQVASSFLCGDCEHKFNIQGEDYLLRNCYRGETRFRLQSLLNRSTPRFSLDKGLVFNVADIPELDSQKIIYFAASIFWRASAHKWKLDSHSLRYSPLGDRYEEELRQFLSDNAPFPKNSSLWVLISRSRTPDRVVTFPFASRKETYHLHRFYVPGILFKLFVGNRVELGIRNLSLNEGGLICLHDAVDEIIRNDSLKLVKSSKVLGRLQKNSN